MLDRRLNENGVKWKDRNWEDIIISNNWMKPEFPDFPWLFPKKFPWLFHDFGYIFKIFPDLPWLPLTFSKKATFSRFSRFSRPLGTLSLLVDTIAKNSSTFPSVKAREPIFGILSMNILVGQASNAFDGSFEDDKMIYNQFPGQDVHL